MTPWPGERVPVAAQAMAVVELVPVVVADSWDTPPEDMVRNAEIHARCRIVSHVKETSDLAPMSKISPETSIPIEPPKLD